MECNKNIWFLVWELDDTAILYMIYQGLILRSHMVLKHCQHWFLIAEPGVCPEHSWVGPRVNINIFSKYFKVCKLYMPKVNLIKFYNVWAIFFLQEKFCGCKHTTIRDKTHSRVWWDLWRETGRAYSMPRFK